MNKATILIASVLKPVTDTRAFNKLAISLRETNKYHINIIGFLQKKTPKQDNIEFTSIFNKNRLHPFRLLAPIKLCYFLIKSKPKLVIITTYELLFPAVLLRGILKYKLVYDVQENYTKNIQFNQTLPHWVKLIAIKYVQFVEKITKSKIDHHFFAEQCYQKEFPDIIDYTILENKFSGKVITKTPFMIDDNTLKFIITGTITPVYGAEQAIHWFNLIRKHYTNVSLEIIGHVPLKKYKSQLESLASNSPGVRLKLSSTPMDQKVIYDALLKANILVLPYHDLPSISPKIPTKIYEGLALGIPMIIPENPIWEELIFPYSAGLAIDFSKPESSLAKFKEFLSNPRFTKPVGPEVTWANEATKLQKVVANLIP
ncbi:glycosyltransferase [Echinicola shivajiensis]|uniref:glycosyltransferase n=1 Tax=Echinicola shivajiensis TaxID=1035916 RepID=UPI001BFCCA98|nr:glycosyltransferase [Echinicola shivajiensis]